MRRLLLTLLIVALICGIAAAVGPLKEVALSHLDRQSDVWDRQRAEDRSKHVEPTLPNLEPEIYSLLYRSEHPGVFRLGEPSKVETGRSLEGYAVVGEVRVDPREWTERFVSRVLTRARVIRQRGRWFRPVLGVTLRTEGGTADLILGRRPPNNTVTHEYMDVMLILVRSDQGIRTVETVLPENFESWPDSPDSTIQHVTTRMHLSH